jgi:hypothetical protein
MILMGGGGCDCFISREVVNDKMMGEQLLLHEDRKERQRRRMLRVQATIVQIVP